MLIAEGVDVRTVASYLGHSNVAETLNTYAEADPDAKQAAVGKIEGSFDVEFPKLSQHSKGRRTTQLLCR